MQKNKAQRDYSASLARFQAVNGQIETVEKVYLADKGIVNADGFVPEALWQIDDENIFEKANADVSKLIEESGLEKKYLEVQKNLTAAEDRLKTVTGSEQPAENDYIEKMRQAFQRNGGDKDPDYAVLHGTIVKHKRNETTAMSVFSQVAPNAVYDKKLAEKVMREVRKSPEYMAMKKEAATAAR